MSSNAPNPIPTGQELKRVEHFLAKRIEVLQGKRDAVKEGRLRVKHPEAFIERTNTELHALHVSLRLVGEKRTQIQNEHLQRVVERQRQIAETGYDENGRDIDGRSRGNEKWRDNDKCQHEHVDSFPPDDVAKCRDCGAWLT